MGDGGSWGLSRKLFIRQYRMDIRIFLAAELLIIGTVFHVTTLVTLC